VALVEVLKVIGEKGVRIRRHYGFGRLWHRRWWRRIGTLLLLTLPNQMSLSPRMARS